MGMTALPLTETRRAFDSVARDYARSNEVNPLLRGMRARVLASVRTQMPAGGHLLDLGCGPGVDAVQLARDGFRVTAIDWSPGMAAEAARRAEAAAVSAQVRIEPLGIHELSRLAPATFDGAYSNFGPLNCVPDLERAARAIAARLEPGAPLVASVIGRVCPWEIGLYAARGDWRRVAVRFARRATPVPLNGGAVWTQYFTPGRFAAACARAGFVTMSVRALGLCAPPPYLGAFASRHPRLVRRLEWLDDHLGGLPPFRWWGDHFLIVLRRQVTA